MKHHSQLALRPAPCRSLGWSTAYARIRPLRSHLTVLYASAVVLMHSGCQIICVRDGRSAICSFHLIAPSCRYRAFVSANVSFMQQNALLAPPSSDGMRRAASAPTPYNAAPPPAPFDGANVHNHVYSYSGATSSPSPFNGGPALATSSLQYHPQPDYLPSTHTFGPAPSLSDMYLKLQLDHAQLIQSHAQLRSVRTLAPI